MVTILEEVNYQLDADLFKCLKDSSDCHTIHRKIRNGMKAGNSAKKRSSLKWLKSVGLTVTETQLFFSGLTIHFSRKNMTYLKNF